MTKRIRKKISKALWVQSLGAERATRCYVWELPTNWQGRVKDAGRVRKRAASRLRYASAAALFDALYSPNGFETDLIPVRVKLFQPRPGKL